MTFDEDEMRGKRVLLGVCDDGQGGNETYEGEMRTENGN